MELSIKVSGILISPGSHASLPIAGALPAEQKTTCGEAAPLCKDWQEQEALATQEGLLFRAHVREYGDKGRCLTWFLWWE